jgi:hypothetical protein
MSDLYDRLEEIQRMVRVLTRDADTLRGPLGGRSIQDDVTDQQAGARRAYVRAVFALVEAVVEQHKRLLLDLAARQVIVLDPQTRAALAEQTYTVADNGIISGRDQYLQLRRKLRLVYRVASEVLGRMAVPYDDHGWQRFGEAIAIRDRITHPKTYADCDIAGDDLDTVDGGHNWFRAVNNEFIRVAREHRQGRGW